LYNNTLIIKFTINQNNVKIYKNKNTLELKVSVPSKAKAIKLDNPAQTKVGHQFETELHRLGGNK